MASVSPVHTGKSGRHPLTIEGLPIFLVFLAIIVALMAIAPNAFLGYRTYLSIIVNYQPAIICALGLTLVIAAGEIDLAFPAILTLTSLVFAAFYRFDIVIWMQAPMTWLGLLHENMTPAELASIQSWICWLGLIAAIGAGAFAGWIAGLLVAWLGIPSIIATLALSFVWRGLAVFLADGKQFALRGFSETALWDVTTGRVFTGLFNTSGVVLRKPDGVPMQMLYGLAIAIFLWFVLNRHRFGESLLFIGDNANVARVLGIDVRTSRVKLFTLMGTLAGIAGVFLTTETENFTTTQGQSSLLIVIAAVFIGARRSSAVPAPSSAVISACSSSRCCRWVWSRPISAARLPIWSSVSSSSRPSSCTCWSRNRSA